MELKDLIKRATEVRSKYADYEKKNYGREWTTTEIAQGFVGDVGDLSKLILAKEGVRKIENVDQKLEHELSDCLWCIFMIAKKYGIDMENSFMKAMDELDQRLA